MPAKRKLQKSDGEVSGLPPNAVHPTTRAKWRAWLRKNHLRSTGIWVVSYKKATGLPRVEYDEAVEEALCFGWVDSLPRKLDSARSMLYFAPRKTGSAWAKSNKKRVENLLAKGLMQPSGLAKVEAAKRDGTWTKLDQVEELQVPSDLALAFEARSPSRKHWEDFPRSVKRGILEWILQAKKPETRMKRIEETARLAAINKRANQWRQ